MATAAHFNIRSFKVTQTGSENELDAPAGVIQNLLPSADSFSFMKEFGGADGVGDSEQLQDGFSNVASLIKGESDAMERALRAFPASAATRSQRLLQGLDASSLSAAAADNFIATAATNAPHARPRDPVPTSEPLSTGDAISGSLSLTGRKSEPQLSWPGLKLPPRPSWEGGSKREALIGVGEDGRSRCRSGVEALADIDDIPATNSIQLMIQQLAAEPVGVADDLTAQGAREARGAQSSGAARTGSFGGDFDAALSSAAAAAGMHYTGRPSSDSHHEYMYHICAAVNVLGPREQAKLMQLMGQLSTAACVDALLSVCDIPPTPRDVTTGGGAASLPASPLKMPRMGTGDLHVCLPRLNISSPQRMPLSVHRHSSGLTPVHGASSGFAHGAGHSPVSTPRKRKADEAAAALSEALASSPAAMQAQPQHCTGSAFGPAPFFEQLPEHQRFRAAFTGHADGVGEQQVMLSPRFMTFGGLGRSMPSPRRRKVGPPSSRDKVWDLLTTEEKEQLLADQISAAEATKALLERRAVQLGCAVADMPDDDDWEIGFKLTECKATSEPLPKPKTCSICLREGMVFHRHSYYCRRCAQLYRAIHRKKTTIQNGQDVQMSPRYDHH